MRSRQYRTCPDCGCNLDSGEICDCKDAPKKEDFNFDKGVLEAMNNVNDQLLIGYDLSNGVDLACLTVHRRDSKKGSYIAKVFYGEEAIKMYQLLTQIPEFLKKEFGILKEEEIVRNEIYN